MAVANATGSREVIRDARSASETRPYRMPTKISLTKDFDEDALRP